MEPKAFDDATELLHRRVDHLRPDGFPDFKQVFRWASERAEDGISIDRGTITGPVPRKFWPDHHKPKLCLTFCVSDLAVETAAEHGVAFPVVHKPEKAEADRPENPAHSEIELHRDGVKQSNPGGNSALRQVITLFKAHMKSLHDSGKLTIDNGRELGA
jgi:hypothetical protein